MHGAQNDFVVIDTRAQTVSASPAFVRWICDRHVGIGADGVLLVGSSEDGTPSMRVLNADGSEAEMCGNGVRCVARFLDENGEGSSFAIATPAGAIETVVVERDPIYRVRVDMGMPRRLELTLTNRDAVAVDVGNPHVVIFTNRPEAFDVVAAGEAMQGDPAFPRGTNVHAVAVENRRKIRVAHYERGAGRTMACGTGAVACVFAARERGLTESSVAVHVPGGELFVEIAGRGRAFMTGPAVRVFDTTIAVP